MKIYIQYGIHSYMLDVDVDTPARVETGGPGRILAN